MKRLATLVLLWGCIAPVAPASAQPPCRPVTIPLPGTPIQVPSPPFQVFVNETTSPVAPIPVQVFLGDVVLVDGDQALADQQSCLYYNQGQIDPHTWSDVMHIGNGTLTPNEATLFSDCDPGDPNDPCLPPYEIDFPTTYTAAQLVNPVFVPEATTGVTQYFPVPGAPYAYYISSDPPEPTSPGCPNQPGPLTFQLYEDCHAIKIDSTGTVIPLQCLFNDPVTGCPSFLLDGTTRFTNGWLRIHEGSLSAPVSDLLHFHDFHFVSFCSEQPDPGEPAEASDLGIPPIPAGNIDPIVDIVEGAAPTLFECGTTHYQIFSDPPEPTAVPKVSWGKLKTLYR